MEIRGERECQDCGSRWSYFESGSVACPDCGSVHSVGIGERAVHTGERRDLDLSAARRAVGDEPLDRVATIAADAARDYVREAGFVVGGDLRQLADADLLAREVEAVGASLARAMRVTDEAEYYFLELLRAPVDGDRPDPTDVPDGLAPERGLALARAVRDYRSDLRTYLEEPDGDLASALSAIRARRKRIEALDGDVDPRYAERLVAAVRDVYAAVERDDETALVRVEERLADEP